MYLQKYGIWQALRNGANKELSTEEIGTKCVGATTTQRTGCGVFWL